MKKFEFVAICCSKSLNYIFKRVSYICNTMQQNNNQR